MAPSGMESTSTVSFERNSEALDAASSYLQLSLEDNFFVSLAIRLTYSNRLHCKRKLCPRWKVLFDQIVQMKTNRDWESEIINPFIQLCK